MSVLSVPWEVISFAVQTTTADRVTDRLFANGNMQVPVIVTIRAINPATGDTHVLSGTELEWIRLIDYYSGTVLSAPWSSSRTPNDFAHTLAGTDEPLNDVEPTSDAPQSVRLYVSSTRIENRVIGAQITRFNSSTVWSTNSPLFNSAVTLTAIQPVTYTTRNVSLGDPQTVATGIWTYSYAMNILVEEHRRDWRQENYYITSHVHPMLKADLHGLATDTTLTNGYAMLWNRTDLNIFYLWHPGPQTARDVGVLHRNQLLIQDIDDPFNKVLHVWTHDARATVQVNQQRDALCLTRMIFAHDGNWAGLTGWIRGAWFRLYDTFGNYGDFNVKVRSSTDEHGASEQIPYLEDRNLATATESLSGVPGPKL